jgi:hypothetical protein
MMEFATKDVVVPDGKSKGQRYSFDRQPVLRLWFEAIDAALWNEYVFTAPSQFGKTLSGFVIPLLYHVCEVQENYVLGLPYGDMIANKWEADIQPVLSASPRLRGLLPKHGSGSGGGRVRDSVTFANGQIVKFMSAGGGDATKAGFTARVFGITEAKAFSDVSETSDEADARRQLQARQRSYPAAERVSYTEGTLGRSDQLPHSLHALSSGSEIRSPCPHCKTYIICEREHLVGWQDAKTEEQAAADAYFICPTCSKKINERQRIGSLKSAVLLHRGQTIDKSGKIKGKRPASRRLYFRANAWHNCFVSAGDIARDEWKAAQLLPDSPDQQSADRELCQFIWCLPWDPPKLDTDFELDKITISNRRRNLPRGKVPAETVRVTAGVDMGMRRGWYCQVATLADGSRHVADYGPFDVPSGEMELGKAIKVALTQLREHFETGLTYPDGRVIVAAERWYDAGYQPAAVLEFVLEHAAGDIHAPDVATYGRGSTSLEKSTFVLPSTGKNQKVRQIGTDRLWFLQREKGTRNLKLYWDTDTIKYNFYQSLTLPSDAAGCVTLYSGLGKEHERLVKHWTNEPLIKIRDSLGREKEIFVRKGAQHLLDAMAMAICADGRLAWRQETYAERFPSSRTQCDWYDSVDDPDPDPDHDGWYND